MLVQLEAALASVRRRQHARALVHRLAGQFVLRVADDGQLVSCLIGWSQIGAY